MAEKEESSKPQTAPPRGTIDPRSLDPRFRLEVAAEPGAEQLQRCFACGVCTGSCPVSAVEPQFSPSRIMRMLLLGMREALLGGADIWYCVQCFSCSFHCPQQVCFADIIRALRHLAVAEGYVSEPFADAIEQVGRITQALRLALVQRLLESRAGEEIPELWAIVQEAVRDKVES